MTRAEKKSGKSALNAVSSHEDAYSTWRQGPGNSLWQQGLQGLEVFSHDHKELSRL